MDKFITHFSQYFPELSWLGVLQGISTEERETAVTMAVPQTAITQQKKPPHF